jgi:p-hydroxybenzoate 3-monooxygenase
VNTQTVLKTSVCILGSGPAGIVLGNILLQNGIDCIVVDKYNREEIYARGRAGAIESTTVNLLKKHGLADTILKMDMHTIAVNFVTWITVACWNTES